MNKNLVIGSVVGAIVLFALGFVIWGMLAADFFAANEGSATGVNREAPILWAQGLGCLIYGVALTLAIQSKGSSASVVDGLTAGALVGVLIWGTADFTLYSVQDVSTLAGTIVDTILEGIRGGIAGAIVALTLSKISG